MRCKVERWWWEVASPRGNEDPGKLTRETTKRWPSYTASGSHSGQQHLSWDTRWTTLATEDQREKTSKARGSWCARPERVNGGPCTGPAAPSCLNVHRPAGGRRHAAVGPVEELIATQPNEDTYWHTRWNRTVLNRGLDRSSFPLTYYAPSRRDTRWGKFPA